VDGMKLGLKEAKKSEEFVSSQDTMNEIVNILKIDFRKMKFIIYI